MPDEATRKKRADQKKRAYHSPLREGQKFQTQRMIVAAMGEELTECGYAGIRMSSVAARAGVSAESVFAVGPKDRVVQLAFEDVVEQDPAARLAGDEGVQRAVAAGDVDALAERIVELVAAVDDSVVRIQVETRANSHVNAELAASVASGTSRRRAGCEHVVARLGLDHEVVLDLCVLLSPETQLQLRDQLDVSRAEYLRWVRASLRARLSMPSLAG